MLFEDVAEKVSAETGIRTFASQAERLLASFLHTDDFWVASGWAHVPVPVASALVRHFREAGYLEITDQDRIVLTEKGRKAVEGLVADQWLSFRCPVCNGRTVDISSVPHWWKQFSEIARERPVPVQEYDQAYVTPETTVARVLFLDERGDLRRRRILVMGAEDDLTGLAIAMTGLPREVLILDIDERLIEFDRRWIEKLGLKHVRAEVFDLRNPFPDEWLGHFDVFITDPPETPLAFKAFIGRGIRALRGPGSVGYFGLTLQDSSLERWQTLQRYLLDEWSTVITDIIQDFNEYVPWPYHGQTRAMRLAPVDQPPSEDTIWYRSAWYRIVLLESGKGTNEPFSEKVLKELYLDEVSSTT